MALLIKSFEDEYGEVRKNLYCVITEYKHNLTDNSVLFSIRPYASQQAKEASRPPLPIGELDLGGIVQNVSKDDDVLAKCYEYIHEQIEIASTDLDGTKTHDPQGAEISDAEAEALVTARNWRTYVGAVDA